MTEHSFSKSLVQSKKDSQDPIWDRIFQHFFPGCTRGSYEEDPFMQRSGVDDIINLNGRPIWIDHKTRFVRDDGRVYRDIALEYLSDKARGTPGWVCKESHANYIIYLNRMDQTCHLMPVKALQLAWNKNGEEWKDLYPSIPAYNQGWITMSIGVPVGVLTAACKECGEPIKSLDLSIISRTKKQQPPKPHENKPAKKQIDIFSLEV